VPPGFIITTEAGQECAESGFHICDSLINEYTRAIHNLERQTGLIFGSIDDAPLLVAVRAARQYHPRKGMFLRQQVAIIMPCLSLGKFQESQNISKHWVGIISCSI